MAAQILPGLQPCGTGLTWACLQGSYFNLTQEWLVRHKYPPGPIHLTRTHMPTLPIYYSVGNFKVGSSTHAVMHVLVGLTEASPELSQPAAHMPAGVPAWLMSAYASQPYAAALVPGVEL